MWQMDELRKELNPPLVPPLDSPTQFPCFRRRFLKLICGTSFPSRHAGLLNNTPFHDLKPQRFFFHFDVADTHCYARQTLRNNFMQSLISEIRFLIGLVIFLSENCSWSSVNNHFICCKGFTLPWMTKTSGNFRQVSGKNLLEKKKWRLKRSPFSLTWFFSW
jgi:hypothetical protein